MFTDLNEKEEKKKSRTYIYKAIVCFVMYSLQRHLLEVLVSSSTHVTPLSPFMLYLTESLQFLLYKAHETTVKKHRDSVIIYTYIKETKE